MGTGCQSVANTAKVVTLGYHSPDRSPADDYCLPAKLRAAFAVIHFSIICIRLTSSAANVGGSKNHIIMSSVLRHYLLYYQPP